MLTRLYSGQIQGGNPLEIGATTPGSIDRACRLVYDGTFQSMDGEVRITPALMQRIAALHNARVLAAGGELPIGECPPVQLDHTKSARDTVGRLVGLLHVAEQLIDGEMRPALLGTVRFLGAENVERATDGRYSNVSIGADLSTGVLTELSVTPFPAAPRASLLSRGQTMDKEKLKKHLMKTAKCSAEDADDKLAKMSDDEMKKLAAEADEDEKKLAAEEDEKAKKLAAEKDEEEKKLAAKRATEGDAATSENDGEKKLTAAKPKLVQLMGQANDAIRLAKMEAKRAEVGVRLSKFRGQAKLTPAEETKLSGEIEVGGKKIRLAEASDEALALLWAVLDSREPVVHTGQLGTVKPLDLSAAGRQVKLAAVAEEAKVTLSNMPFTAKMMAAGQKAGAAEGDKPAVRPADAAHVEPAPAVVTESAASIESQEKRLSALQDQITKLGAITTALAEALA